MKMPLAIPSIPPSTGSQRHREQPEGQIHFNSLNLARDAAGWRRARRVTKRTCRRGRRAFRSRPVGFPPNRWSARSKKWDFPPRYPGPGRRAMRRHRGHSILGFRQSNGVLLLQEREDRLMFQIVSHDFFSQFLRQVGLIERERAAVGQSHPLDARHGRQRERQACATVSLAATTCGRERGPRLRARAPACPRRSRLAR